MDAGGMTGEKTEDGRQRGTRDAQIAARHGADQEIDLIEPVRHGSAGLVHLQPDRRQRFGARHLPLLGRPLFPKSPEIARRIRRQDGEAGGAGLRATRSKMKMQKK
jgi:hypothetical protein